jgi:hypothetical protein
MEDKKKETLKLLPANESLENSKEEPEKESFLKRALNRTRDAIKSVDEAITGREAAKRIEDRFAKQSELNEALMARIEDLFEHAEQLQSRVDEEVAKLVDASNEQRETFERTFTEITTTATEVHAIAQEAQQTLNTANNQQLEVKKQTDGQLARWHNDADTLKTDVRNLQSQLTQLQQSFEQFLITTVVGLVIVIGLIVFLFIRG